MMQQYGSGVVNTALDYDWLSEFEQQYWSGVVNEKEKPNEEEKEMHQQQQQQTDSLTVADYGWPNNMENEQSFWDPHELFDVDELLGDMNEGTLPAPVPSQDQHQIYSGTGGYDLHPLQLEPPDGHEFLDLSSLDVLRVLTQWSCNRIFGLIIAEQQETGVTDLIHNEKCLVTL